MGGGKFDNDDEIIVLPQNTIELDIAPAMREMVYLNHPIKLLCRDDCKGLCPNCGMDLNAGECRCEEGMIDPRWEELRKLIK